MEALLRSKPKRAGAQAQGYLPLPGSAPTSSSPTLGTASSGAPGGMPRLPHRVSPGPEIRRSRSAGASRPVLPGTKQAVAMRQKDKVVLLPGDAAPPLASLSSLQEEGEDSGQERGAALSIFEDIDEDTLEDGSHGRLTVYCICESLERKVLDGMLSSRYPGSAKHSYTDVLHLELEAGSTGHWPTDVFFFDYGVVCTWGLSLKQEQEVVQHVASSAARHPLPTGEVEIDQFLFRYSTHEPPSMQNDTITINRRQAADHRTKLAICHALAQSTKLCVYEERVLDMVLQTKHLPEELAEHGTVHVGAKKVAQLIGHVFLQRSAVNLLSTVLDTPEFFWSAPDQLQALYERVCEYLELETRVEVLNARFQVLQEMLDMLRDHHANAHNARLEWIIIWLIAVELIVGLCQLAGLFGLVGQHGPE